MVIDYKKEILIGEMEVRLQGQEMAKRSNEISIMRFKSEIDRLQTTNDSLDIEMQKTREMLKEAKGGE